MSEVGFNMIINSSTTIQCMFLNQNNLYTLSIELGCSNIHFYNSLSPIARSGRDVCLQWALQLYMIRLRKIDFFKIRIFIVDYILQIKKIKEKSKKK